MKKLSIYLFRHALATHSKSGYGDKILTAEILPEGKPPIERMAKYLDQQKIDSWWASPILRCQQTVKIISTITQQSFETKESLTEYYQETFQQLKQRIKDIVQLINNSPNKSIAICSHGTPIAGIKNLLLTNNFNEEKILDFPETGELLVIENSKFKIINFN